MTRKPTAVGAAGGALSLSALALAFGLCCVSPWAVAVLGVGGAVLLARLAFIQPYLVSATFVLLGVGFWAVYRRPRTGARCDVAQRYSASWLVWGAALLVIIIDIASFAPWTADVAGLRSAARFASGLRLGRISDLPAESRVERSGSAAAELHDASAPPPG